MLNLRRVTAVVCVLLSTSIANAIDIDNVMQFSIDQPSIYTMVERVGQSGPLTDRFGAFTFDSFLDTGSSSVIFSREIALFLGIETQMVSGQNVVFRNSGATGSANFDVSETLNIGLAAFTPNTPLDDLTTIDSTYTHRLENVRVQLEDEFSSSPINVIGMPGVEGKVAVIDPKPLDDFSNTMNAYIYEPGTPFNPSAQDSNPGIPSTSHHIQLSYGDFSRFTDVTPAGGIGPATSRNPFIGPDPVARLDANPPVDNTPPVEFSLNGRTTEGSLLFDTGAAVSFVSREKASDLNVRYRPGTFGSAAPLLEVFDPADPGQLGTLLPDQFRLDVGGVVGNVTFSGFYLDQLSLKTSEGDMANDEDPNHLNFIRAPVLVNDIQLRDPNTNQLLTLDGVFGMNYLAASGDIGEVNGFPALVNETPGNFEWIVFDDVNGTLGLTPKSPPANCDFNNSGSCDIADLDLLMYTGLGSNDVATFDLDGSGAVDLGDRDAFLVQTDSLPGDATLNGVVSAADLNAVGSNWQESVSSWGDGDFNGDGVANSQDLNILGVWWTKSSTDFSSSQSAPAAATVPEPSGFVLLVCGAMIRMARRRR